MSEDTKTEKSKTSEKKEFRLLPERPKRSSYKSTGSTNLPPVKGFRTAIRKIREMDGSESKDFELALAQGYIPVQAHEIGYDDKSKRLNPLAPDAHVYVNLRRNEQGIYMKIPQEWYDEMIKEGIQDNNSILKAKSSAVKTDKSDDPNLIETAGEVSFIKR